MSHNNVAEQHPYRRTQLACEMALVIALLSSTPLANANGGNGGRGTGTAAAALGGATGSPGGAGIRSPGNGGSGGGGGGAGAAGGKGADGSTNGIVPGAGGAGGSAGTGAAGANGGNGANAVSGVGAGGGGGGGATGNGAGSGAASVVNLSGTTLLGGNGGNGGRGNTVTTGNPGSGGGGGGGEGGQGALITANTVNSNAGVIRGGVGGAGGASGTVQGTPAGGNGGDGGIGVHFTATGASLTNSGTIMGGAGGAGGTGIVSGVAGAGGAGIRGAGNTVGNSGAISGGASVGSSSNGTNGMLTGGAGISAGANFIVNNSSSGTISGGAGTATSGTAGAVIGGAGISVAGNGSTLTNLGSITGGAAAATGGNAVVTGGAGISGTGDLSIVNTSTITGGTGTRSIGTAAVTGGAGISGVGGFNIANSGTISGGAGTATGGTPALTGGVGISGAGGFYITNSGTISGGAGAGGALANAIAFTSGSNSLEIRAGSIINGNVRAQSTDTLLLGGTVNATFDAALIGPTAQYGGFGQYTKTGSSTWTLTNATTALTPWQLNQGTLNVSADGALGASTGGITFGGGTLQWGSAFNLAAGRAILLNVSGGTFDTQGFSSTVAQGVTGAGGLTKAGAGTLVLSGDSSYTGGTTIAAGTLQLGNGGTGGSIVGDATNNGTLAFNRSGVSTFAGTVSGTGSLAQMGPGTTILTGANTYAGGTTISGGTLQLGNGGTGGSIVGDVTNNGTLAFNRSGVSTFAGAVSGTGGLAQMGPGTTVLTGASTYAGGTTISGGTLQLGNGGASGSIVGDVTNNGTLAFNRSDVSTFAGAVSGTGSLAQTGPGTTILTGANTYAGGTTISGGTLQVSSDINLGAATGALTLGAGTLRTTSDMATARATTLSAPAGGTIETAAGTTLLHTGSVGGAGALIKAGAGTLVLTADATYAGGTIISGGTLQLGNGGTGGSIVGDVANNGTLAFGRSGVSTFGGAVSGSGALVQMGPGTTILAGANTYAGGTTVSGGTLQLGDGATSGSIVGDVNVANNGTLAFNRSNALTLAGAITGGGTLSQIGSGTTILSGNSAAFSGAASVTHGVLWVNGVLGGAASTMTVSNGGTFGGTGSVGGNVAITNGSLAPGNSPGTLTINGTLSLAGSSVLNYEFGQSNIIGGSLNDLTVVGGNLTLDGTINVATAGGGALGPGINRIFNYGGALTNNGLDIGTQPSGGTLLVQTSVDKQVNLINTAGLTLNFWDGGTAARNNYAVNGGEGVWQAAAGNDNWTEPNGDINAPYAAGSFAIFTGTGGTVTVDGSAGAVTSGGMQFASSGYAVQGGPITLAAGSNILRVGDGTGPGANYVATIAAELTGSGGIEKTDLGTLVLSAANSYAGGTTISGGTLQLGNGGASGSIVGDVANNGTLAFNRSDVSTFAGAVSGTGSLAQTGPGTTILTGANTYAGGTTISGGTLQVSSDINLGAATGALTLGAGTLRTTSDMATARATTLSAPAGGTIETAAGTTLLHTGSVGGAGALIKAGAGTLVLTADATYAGGTTISGGTLQLGNGGTGGSIVGDVTNNGTLVFDRSDALAFGGVIGGSGNLTKLNDSNLTLTGANSYSGGTKLKGGQITVGHSAALGTGTLAMDEGTTLGFSAGGLNLPNNVVFTGTTDPIIDTGTFTETMSGAISGGGALTKNGSGTLVLSGGNTYTGSTNIAQGTLKAGAANTFSAASTHSVAPGSTFDLAGFSQTLASLANSGTVSLLGTSAGTTLTINGNYVGNDGVLKLGTTLSSTGPSDRLVINGGTASGKTSVQITNLAGLGGLTTGDGIELVTAKAGATTTAQTTKDAFTLANGHVDAGAYEYRLYAADARGAGENWFLRSSIAAGAPPGAPVGPAGPVVPAVPVVTYRAEASLYAALPGQLRQANVTMIGDLRKREGDDDAKSSAAIPADSVRRAWGRVLTTGVDIEQGGTVSPDSKSRLTGFQVGTDLLTTRNWRAGIYAGQLDGDASVRGFASGIKNLAVGRNDMRSQYVGAYGTYTGDSGFYANAVVQSGRHRYTVAPLGSRGVDGKGNSLLGSVEVGQAFPLGGTAWSVEPQLQLIHQSMDLDNAAIVGAITQPQADSGWVARAGVRVKGQIDTGIGVLQPYGRFNIYKSSGGADIARFVNGAATTDISAPTGGTSTELAGGFTLTLGQLTSLYGEVGKLWASGGNAKVKSSANGSIGVRVKW